MSATMATCGTIAAILAAAQPGDVVTLSGNCPKVTVPAKAYAPPLVIDARGAAIAGVRIKNATGIIWRGGTITAPGGYGTQAKAPVADAGYGLTVGDSTDVRIEGVTVRDARLGIVIGGSTDVVLAGSTITAVGEDGIRAIYNTRLTVVGNRIVDFAPIYARAHPDAGQFYSNKGLVIAGNFVAVNAQGLSDFGGNNDPFNEGVVLVGNSVRVSGFFHSMTWTSSRGLTAIGNDVGPLPEWKRNAPLRLPAGAMACGNSGQVAAALAIAC